MVARHQAPGAHDLVRVNILLAGFLLATATAAACTAAERLPRPPNILFILSDDQRYDTLGAAGHPILRTPTLDRLAADGVRFRQAFVTTSVCWVSRAVTLTGQWARSHIRRDSVPTVRPDALATMFPALLRSAGYRTAHFGKWHLMAPPGFSPADHYDVFEAIGRNPYFKPLPNGSRRHETDLVCDRGIDFLRAHPRDRPFLLHLWFNASHAEDNDRRPGAGHYPWPPSADGLYDDVAIPAPRLGDPAIVAGHPRFLTESINRQRFFWGYDTPEKFTTNVRAYYRMITGIDYAVARVLSALEASGHSDNTIVVYSSDNGYYLGDRGFQGKWSHFDESLRVPLIIRDPRQPSTARGRVVDAMTLNVDLPATFLDWAGVARPAGYEGRSLAPLVRGEPASGWRTHFFCEHLDLAPTLTWEGVRGERFVYARYFDQRPAFEFLHDLQEDPDELRNLAFDPARAADLARMRALCDEEMNRRGGALPPMEERGTRKSGARKAAKQP